MLFRTAVRIEQLTVAKVVLALSHVLPDVCTRWKENKLKRVKIDDKIR